MIIFKIPNVTLRLVCTNINSTIYISNNIMYGKTVWIIKSSFLIYGEKWLLIT